jgi:RNA ligase (TIGR02306 family)
MTNWDNRVQPDRCMARIVNIDKIDNVEGADSIELAFVLGWQCVVKKNEFKVGEKAIYVSLDSVASPDDINLGFLEGKYVKTRKIMKTLSQGVLLKLDCITKKDPSIDLTLLKIGYDVSSVLDVFKYVNPEEKEIYESDGKSTGNKDTKSKFPDYVPKTDEERLQNKVHILRNLIGKNIVITRKEDGSSGTYIFNNGNFIIASRNFIVYDSSLENKSESSSSSLYQEISKKFNIVESMKRFGKNIALQGEIVGPKVNGNKLKLAEYDYRIFNIYDIDNKKYIDWNEVKMIARELRLNTVPELFLGPMTEEFTFDYLMHMAESLEYIKGQKAEGIVVKTLDNKTSFKVISNKYLMSLK